MPQGGPVESEKDPEKDGHYEEEEVDEHTFEYGCSNFALAVASTQPMHHIYANGSLHLNSHPATYEELAPIWLPADPLGIGELEVQKLRALGIASSTAGCACSLLYPQCMLG